jgi:hypothetical protein
MPWSSASEVALSWTDCYTFLYMFRFTARPPSPSRWWFDLDVVTCTRFPHSPFHLQCYCFAPSCILDIGGIHVMLRPLVLRPRNALEVFLSVSLILITPVSQVKITMAVLITFTDGIAWSRRRAQP